MSEEKQAKSISGFWRRLGAFAIDCTILGLFGQGLGLFFGELFIDLGAWGSLLGFAIALVYFGVMNSEIAAGQTLGKKVLKIRVVDGDNQPISLIKSFGRFSIIGIPYFLNGASPQFPTEMLTSFWAYVLSIIIFGGLFSIVYLYLFNRNTRQSLHDLLVRTYVVNVGMDKQHVAEMWRPHVAVVSLLFLCPAIVLVPVFSTGLQQQQQFADPVSIEQLLRENPAVSYASVEGRKRITSTLKTGTTETTYVIAQVFLRKNEISNTKLARELAELVATNYQDVQKKDVLKINLIYGYDIGIVGKSRSHMHHFNPQEFEIKTETNNAKVQKIIALPSAHGYEYKNLLDLLDQKKYVEIEGVLIEVAASTEKNPENEIVLNNYLDQFSSLKPALENKLDQWVTARNGSYIPYLARGIYYTSLGWNRRGYSDANQTSQSQVNGMQFYFEKAVKDFSESLRVEPRQVHSQSYLIGILMNFGQSDQMAQLLSHALTYRPDSLTVRWNYLTTLLPRWGGAIEKMSSFVASARPYYDTNPALKVLEGRVKAEIGDQHYFDGRYQSALTFYTQALEAGEHSFYLKQRGEVLLRTDQYESAIEDFSNAIKIRPNDWKAFDQRGVAYKHMNEQESAIHDLTLVIRHQRGGARVINARGEIYLAQKKYDEALSDFEKAVLIDPNDKYYQANKNRVKMLISQR